MLALALAWMALWGLTVAFAAATDAKLKSQLDKSLGGGEGTTTLVGSGVIVGLACMGLIWLVMHRLGPAEMVALEERMEIEHEVLDSILEQRLAAEYEKLDAWKSEQVSTTYQMVLDQQARGLLPCPNCDHQQHGERRRSA